MGYLDELDDSGLAEEQDLFAAPCNKKKPNIFGKAVDKFARGVQRRVSNTLNKFF